jgi:isopropylmalate/homocitrate/citramalate synthase
VSPHRVPQMADTEKVYEGIDRCPGVTYSVLVLNRKGLDLAISAGLGHVSIFVSASETRSRENRNCFVAEATIAARLLIEQAKSFGLNVQAGVMNDFGCRFEGKILALGESDAEVLARSIRQIRRGVLTIALEMVYTNSMKESISDSFQFERRRGKTSVSVEGA